VLVLGAAWIYLVVDADQRLRAALAETNHLDPEWGLDQLEANQTPVPDPENSALQVLAVRKLIPQQWGSDAFWQLLQNLPPERQLNDRQFTTLRTERAKAEKAAEEARKLADMPRGRYHIEWVPDFYEARLDHVQEARMVASLLQVDALVRAQEGDADGALRSTRAVLQTGRSIGDAPTNIPQLIRIAQRALAVDLLERVLAQGQPSSRALADLQHLLEDEERHPTLLIAARGERAGDDRLMEYLQAGGLNRAEIQKQLDNVGTNGLSLSERLPLYLPGGIKRQRAALLRHMNEVVEIAKLPSEQQQEAVDRWSEAARSQPVLVKVFAPAMNKMVDACRRSSADLRAAIVLLAAERYRQERKQLPESLAALVQGGYLKSIPTDPYDGQPLRFRLLEDGLVVYALGRDGQDNGGNLRRTAGNVPGTDEGCRLWVPEKRRQAPLPVRAPDLGGPP
jgi:hypothetical protein